MPGSHYNDTERKLESAWNANKFGEYPLLKAIEIQAVAGSSLRGIKSLRLELNYPVSFLTGHNGTGKSTLLALATLAYHGKPGHIASFAKSIATSSGGDFSYFTFKDFFHRGPGDPVFTGIDISWTYDGSTKDISVEKRSSKWMRYERRPSRPVDFFGISRAIPTVELSFLRNKFGANISDFTPSQIAPKTRAIIETILNRSYPKMEKLSGKKFSIRRTSDGGYTSFNMGAGEDSLIALLARLAELPEGSLVVIDEIETALHPSAQRRLASALLELALERKLQIIGSTHSHHIIDGLPKAARNLVIREGDQHRIVYSPTTMLALAELSEQNNCELLIICEDLFAAALVKNSLSAQTRKRIDIQACGSKSELARVARSHLRISKKAKCLIVWDGDVTEIEATEFMTRAKEQVPDPNKSIDSRLDWICLPGKSCPELWALETLKENGLSEVQLIFGFDNQKQASQALSTCGKKDPHDIPYELTQHVGWDQNEVSTRLATCAASVGNADLKQIVQKIKSKLN